MSEATLARIREDVRAHPILIYLKGTPTFPQCGFPGAVYSGGEFVGKALER